MSTVPQDSRRFHLHDRIGTGGFGDVYRATMVSSSGVETMVAIKVLHKDLAPDGQALQRLRDEGKALGHLRHPSIVRVMDLVELDGRAALVTEYVEGVDIGICFRQGGLGPRALVGIVGQVAAGLDAAWNTELASGEKLRLVHRDVKPENIRVGRQGDIKLLDFGIAKAAGMRREAKTEAGDVVGSYRYMAPERLARSHDDSPEGDVYSLAAVAFEGLAGERLFAGRDLRGHVMIASDAQAHNAFIAERLAALERFGSVVRNLLSACLAYDPRLRPSAAKMAAICDDLTDTLPGKNLRQWMRTWSWPDEDRGQGPLTGKVIRDLASAPPSAMPSASPTVPDNITVMVFDDEPTREAYPIVTKPSVGPVSSPPAKPDLFKPTPKDSPEPTVRLERRPASPPPGRGSSRRVWAGFAAFAVLVLGGSAVFGAMGVLVVYQGRSAESEQDVALVEIEPALRPVANAGEPTPAPEPEPEPVVEAALSPAPTPASPDGEGSDEAVAPTGPGSFATEGKVPIQLRRGEERVVAGPVPTGAWSVFADWGEGFVRDGQAPPVVVFSGTTVLVRCNKLKRLCEVELTEPGDGTEDADAPDAAATPSPEQPQP